MREIGNNKGNGAVKVENRLTINSAVNENPSNDFRIAIHHVIRIATQQGFEITIDGETL